MPKKSTTVKEPNDPTNEMTETEVQQSENGAHEVDVDAPDGEETTLDAETEALIADAEAEANADDHIDLNPDEDDLLNAGDGSNDGDPSQLPDAPQPDSVAGEVSASGPAPATNMSGHRNRFVNNFGDATIMDDDTAKMFYENPAFYSYTYDAQRGDSVHVSQIWWCDEEGNKVGGRVGEPYELGK